MASLNQKSIRRESLLFLLILAGILVALNVASAYFHFGRIDLTANNLFSLADGSKSVVENLDDQLEITAYFTEDLPPPFNATERQVRDLLQEYAAVSNRIVRVNFINPHDEETEGAARDDGVIKVQHQNIESDQVSVIEGYRGLVLKYLGEKRTIPVVENTEGLEYTMTMAIKELTGDKKKIGLVSGHESPTLQEGMKSIISYLPTYDLVEVDVTKEIDGDLAALLIVEPQTAFSEDELRYIDQYVMRGGSLGVFGGSLKLDISGPTASPVDTQINQLLKPWGIEIQSRVVADWQCRKMPMPSPGGFQVLVPYPPFPIVQLTPEQQKHPVMFRLGTPTIPFAAQLSVGKVPADVTVTTLADSSKNSWALSGTPIALKPRDPREWQPSSDVGPFPIAAAIEGKLPSAFSSVATSAESNPIVAPAAAERPVRVFVSGSSSFLLDQFVRPKQPNEPAQLDPGVSMQLNAIDWLAADSDLAAIRAKSIEEPALAVPDAVTSAESAARAAAESGDEVAVEKALQVRNQGIKSWDRKKTAYRLVNTLGIPFLVVFYGVLRWRRRSSMRKSLTI